MRLPDILRGLTPAPGRPTRRLVPQGVIGKEAEDDRDWWDRADREVNPDLAGRARYRLLDLMVMSDPVAAGSLLGMKLPIGAADVRVEPAGPNPVDRFVAAAAAEQLGITRRGADRWMVDGFDDLLWSLLLVLDYGSMTHERVWAPQVREWRDADGDSHAVIALERLAPRYPHTLFDYRGAPSITAPLASVRQDGVKNPIDGSRLVHTVLGRERARFIGSSLLRPAYGMWKLKRELMVAAAVGYGRHMFGTPSIGYPENEEGAKEQAASIGRGHRSNELSFFAYPIRADGDKQWSFEVINGAKTLADPIPLLRHFDEQMVSASLERFFMLGSTETGSRAVGEVLAEPYYLALNWLAGRMADVIGEQVLRPWVDVNFGPQVKCPVVRFDTIQQRNLPSRGRFIAEAAAAGVDFSDLAAQNEIRGWVDIVPLPDDYQREGTSPL